MKKVTLAVIVLLLGFSEIDAQVELKALVGTNFASFRDVPSGFESSANAGFQFGGGVLIGDRFYVEPGIQFLKNSKTITSETEEIEFDQNFVKIPVYLGYHIFGHESTKLALRVFAGPAVSIAGKITKGEDQITKDDVKNAVWMGDVGLGLDIFFLFVEANYEIGLNDYFTDSSNNSKHNGFILNAGAHIDF
jgi:hypothetical protein